MRSRPWRRGLAVLVGVLLMSMGAASGASAGGYTVTAECTVAGQTSPCGTGWYTSNVALSWTWSPQDGGNPIDGCVPHSYVQDTSVNVSCTVAGPSGETAASQPLHIEISTPTATAVPQRPPDSNGWYNHAVAATVTGSSFSGIASCSSGTYSGPDSENATVSGTCTDNAGKTADATTSAFPYSASPPTLQVVADPADQVVVVRWGVADMASPTSVSLVRTPGRRRRGGSVLYRGTGAGYRDAHVRDGVRYRYTLIATDSAGNTAIQSTVVTPGPRLLSPAYGARLSAPPALQWVRVVKARYYNVQLYRNGRKILSEWPTHPSLQLRLRWRFAGRRYRLRPGLYRWYVWPGLGPRAAARYGPAIGTRTFVITPA